MLRRLHHEQPESFAFTPANLEWAKGQIAKYPPGHAPMLVPGVWLRNEGLMPVLLAGLSAALIFLLARRLSDPWIAMLTWGIWTLAPRTLSWYATYFSQTTTAPDERSWSW